MSGLLKVGVIGTGGIAWAHFPGWQESPHAEMVAFADVSEERLHNAGSQQGVHRLYTSAEELLADKDIDIVDICTPNHLHTPLAMAALEAGKHVICEKPLATTSAEIHKLIEARNRSGKLLMTAQHFRFDGRAAALKAEIDTGVLGEVYHTRCWVLRRAAAPVWSPGFYRKEQSGGGPCIDIGVHILDLALWYMGHPTPVTVTGVTQDKLAKVPGAFSIWGGKLPAEFDVEEFATAFVRFDNGASLILEVSWLLHHLTEQEDMQMWLYGTNGGAHWPRNDILTSDNDSQQLSHTQIDRHEHGSPHAKEIMAFAEAVALGKPSPVPPEQSLIVQSILDGLYLSAEQGREVSLHL